MKKLLITAAANNLHFIRDIAEAMRDEFEINYFDPFGTPDFHDVIWHEWFDGWLSRLLEMNKIDGTKYIVRLHRYELFTPRTLKSIQDVTDSGDYKKIDKLVFVSEFVRQLGISKFPWMKDISVVIPNLFDHTKFPIAENKKKGYNLLFLGRISYMKNLPLCLTMFHELLKLDSNYKLHIIGEISDLELKYYAKNFMNKTKIWNSITWHGRVKHEKLPDLMADMSYIICSSISEAHPVGIIESICCGLKPVIFDFPGAENMYPEKWRWMDRKDFVHNILSPDYNPQEYRDYAIDMFSIQKNIGKYKSLINEVIEGG